MVRRVYVSDSVYLALLNLKIFLKKRSIDDVIRFLLETSSNDKVQKYGLFILSEADKEIEEKKNAEAKDRESKTIEGVVQRVQYVGKKNVAWVLDVKLNNDQIVPLFIWSEYEDILPQDIDVGDKIIIENVSLRKSKKGNVPFILSVSKKTKIMIEKRSSETNIDTKQPEINEKSSPDESGEDTFDYYITLSKSTLEYHTFKKLVNKDPLEKEDLGVLTEIAKETLMFARLSRYYPEELLPKIAIIMHRNPSIFPRTHMGMAGILSEYSPAQIFEIFSQKFEPKRIGLVSGSEATPQQQIQQILFTLKEELEHPKNNGDVFFGSLTENGIITKKAEDPEALKRKIEIERNKLVALLKKAKTVSEFWRQINYYRRISNPEK